MRTPSLASASRAPATINQPSFASVTRLALGELWAGLAASLVALPSAIAFGVVIFTAIGPSHAAAGALAGIIGAATLGILTPLIGRNPGLITAPCAPAAAVMAGAALEFSQAGKAAVGRVFALLILTALISAALQLLFGAIRAGRLIKFIPYQVVSGYLSGVAIIIATAQLPKLLGVPSHTSLADAVISFELWQWPGVVVGLVTVTAMVVAPFVTKKIPSTIVALVAGIAAYGLLALRLPSLRTLTGNSLVIGAIGGSGGAVAQVVERLSSLSLLSPGDLALVFVPAATLSVLLSIDTLKTGVVLDAMVHRRLNSNRELVAQGIANLASAGLGGIPGAGTMGPTLVNVTSGSKTMWSSVLAGAFIVIAAVAFRDYIGWVPIATLAGILLVIAFRMFEFRMFRLLFLPSARFDFVVIATVVIVAETIGLIEASLVGVLLAILLFIRDQIRGSVILRRNDLRALRSRRRRPAEETAVLDANGEKAAVVQLQGNLFFGTTDQLFSELEHDLATRRWILLDLRRVQSLDYTAAHLIDQMHERMHERDGEILFSGMPSALRADVGHYMRQLGLVGSERGIQVFETRDSAIEWMEQQILEEAGAASEESDSPLTLSEFHLFSALDSAQLAELQPAVRPVTVAPGQKLFSGGEEGDEMYFVRSGRIHVLLPIESGVRHHLATICRGEFFGEMSFLDNARRSADAEAAIETALYALSRARFEKVVQNDPRLAGVVFEQLACATAERLRTANQELRALEER